MGLFKPAWMSKNWDKSVAAVENMTDQNELKRVAKEAPTDGARIAAAKKISDQSFISEIAKYDTEWFVRRAVVELLTDQFVLEYIRKNDKENNVASAASERLSNLYRWEAEKQAELRMVEIKKMTDQNQLVEIAINDKSSYKPFGYKGNKSWCAPFGCAAVESLTDQGLLHYVAKKAEEEEIRIAAVEKITNQSLLEDILEKCYGDYYICMAAVNKLIDQSAFAKVANNNNHYFEVRETALNKLTTKSQLKEIATTPTKEPLKFLSRVPDKDDYTSLCDAAKHRLLSLKHEETCKGNHDWIFDKHDSYLYGDTMNEFDIYICAKCGKKEETNHKSYKW